MVVVMAHNKQNGSYGKLTDLLKPRSNSTFNAVVENPDGQEYDENRLDPNVLLSFKPSNQLDESNTL